MANGLLDFLNTPQGIGLLSGIATYAANARRGTPVNNIGRGLAGGLAGYGQAQDAIKQAEKDAFNQKYQQAVMDQMVFNMDEAKRQREGDTAFKDSIKNLYKPGTPEQTTFDAPVMFGGSLPDGVKPFNPQATVTPAKPATFSGQPVDPMFGALLQSGQVTPQIMAIYSNNEAARQQRMEEKLAALEAAAAARQENLDFRREQAAQSAADRRELARQSSADRMALARLTAAQGNKPPAGYRYKPNGDLEMIPGGPADSKNQQRLEGGGTVSSVVGGLRDMYNQLRDAGGITSTKNRAGTNLGAGIASSGVGQMAGRLFGTENQSLRNTIAQQRPLLLQAIMKATGMSAKQMDSNAELKLYLSTATDPTLDVEANMRALDKIEELYGSGAGNPSITGKTGGDKPSGGVKFLGFE